jgi:hypothetical protein
MRAQSWSDLISEFAAMSAAGQDIGRRMVTVIARSENSPAAVAILRATDRLEALAFDVRVMLVEAPSAADCTGAGTEAMQRRVRTLPDEAREILDERSTYACLGDRFMAGGTESASPCISLATQKTLEMNRFVFDLLWVQSQPLLPAQDDPGAFELRPASFDRRVANR